MYHYRSGRIFLSRTIKPSALAKTFIVSPQIRAVPIDHASVVNIQIVPLEFILDNFGIIYLILLGELGVIVMLIGLARTSILVQVAGFESQIRDLEACGCERIF